MKLLLIIHFLIINLTVFATNNACLNITDFGVIVNGTTDNSVNFQRAVDSAAVIGSSICMPAGIYRINKTINIPAGVRLAGAGIGSNALQTPYNGTIIWYTGDSAALTFSGTNCGISDLTVYTPVQTATTGILLLAKTELVESFSCNNVLIYGFTGGTALKLEAASQGGIAYCSFYDVRIRHAKVGIEIKEDDSTSFVNSNSFFHGAISGGGFDYGILINGGNNNVWYGTVIEPYSSTFGHLVVKEGQVIGENIRIEAVQQTAGIPVINFSEKSALSRITGFFAGGTVINQGNNFIDMSSSNYNGDNLEGYNLFTNASFNLPNVKGIPEFWTISSTTASVVALPGEVITGQKILSIKIPPGETAEFYPRPEYAPKLGTYINYTYANMNVLVRTSGAGRAKMTYNSLYGVVSSTAHTGSGQWENIGLQALTNVTTNPNPRININNAGNNDTLVVDITAPSFNFGLNTPQRQSAVLTTAGGIITGTLTTGLNSNYSFTAGTTYLVLPKTGNIFNLLSSSSLSITRINYLIDDRFPVGTQITLLFNSVGNSVQNNAYIQLKSNFSSTGANTSLTLISNGDGTWREVNRNN